jgi:hypothetical protein
MINLIYKENMNQLNLENYNIGIMILKKQKRLKENQ